jgi:hypothetical protein
MASAQPTVFLFYYWWMTFESLLKVGEADQALRKPLLGHGKALILERDLRQP